MIISPDLAGEKERGVSDAFLADIGHSDGTSVILRVETLGQELGRIADVLDSPQPRELTPEEERDVDNGWTTPAAIRARDARQ